MFIHIDDRVFFRHFNVRHGAAHSDPHVFDSLFLKFNLPLGWIFHFAIILSAVIVLRYIFLSETHQRNLQRVLQFF